jgi:hypothetical protein
MAIEFRRVEPKWPPDSEVQDLPRRGRQIREPQQFQTAPVTRPAVGQGGFAERIAGEYRRADLGNPEKLERMVRESARELVAGNTALAAGLSEQQKEHITEFLSADPSMRKQLEQYLAKVLK